MKTSENRKYIKIRGANEHNLKNIDVDIPRDEFVVLTGLSGSGKSSLAFDTIYAEGQRRYMESLVLLCKTVFRTDGKAGCGEHRRAFSGNFHRSEIHKPESAVNGGNGHGDLRLFPVCFMQGLECHIVRSVEKRSKNRRSIRWSIRSWQLPERTKIQLFSTGGQRKKRGACQKFLEQARAKRLCPCR